MSSPKKKKGRGRSHSRSVVPPSPLIPPQFSFSLPFYSQFRENRKKDKDGRKRGREKKAKAKARGRKKCNEKTERRERGRPHNYSVLSPAAAVLR